MTFQAPQEEDHLTHSAFLLLGLSDPEVQVLGGEFSWGHSPSSHSALTPSLPRGDTALRHPTYSISRSDVES